MHLKETITRYKLHHLLTWLLVFTVWLYLRYQDYRSFETAFYVTLIKVADIALLIYICNYLLIPKLLYKKKYLFFALSFVMIILVSSIYKMQLLGWITNNPSLSNFKSNWKGRIYDNILPHFFLVIAGAAFKLLTDQLKLQKRVAEIAKEKAEAELSFLKSQINPHFLFNSLNSVYFLIDKKNEEARNALHKFAEMLRYQLYECNGERIPIDKELNYLKDYVDLQRLRLNKNCSVRLDCSPDVKDFSIQPLLLLPLVENSFKHLSHYTQGKCNEVQIRISRSNGHVNFWVRNTTEGKQSTALYKDGGIGLANVRKRLELLYPKRHDLSIEQKEGWFTANLTFPVNEDVYEN
jgi:sensor histidine kinase YesM